MAQARTSVLIVEDEGLVARDLEYTLGDLGYEVTGTAATAEDALSTAAAHLPDVVLMDIRLRGAMDGIDAARLLRERFHVPVVFLTAHVDDRTVARAAETEPYGYVVKPFNVREVRSAIEIAVSKHAGETRRGERERWFSTVLASLGEAVMACDPSLHVSFMNPAAERLTGWGELEARGRPLGEVFQLMSPEGRGDVESRVASSLKDRAVTSLAAEALLFVRGGVDKHMVSASSAPIVRDDVLLGAVVAFHDLSEQRKMQEQRALAEHVASLSTLVAGLAHEINNPLSYNLANVEYAIAELDRQGADRTRRVTEALVEAREGAYRVASIVSDFRKLSRAAGETSGLADVNLAIEWALKVADNKIRHVAHIERHLDPVPPVRGSDGRLSQVFVNLLVNAAEAMTGSPEDNLIRVTLRFAGDMVIVEVHDNGPGISPDDLRRVFDPFFTTKPAGSGLGLSISRGILRSLGGDLEVDSAPGRGTTFRVELPPAAALAASSGETESSWVVPQAAGRRRGAVLIVDDDELLRAALGRMLEGHHAVTAVAGAREALSVLKQGGSFDVILCDVMMPERSGVELYEELVATDPATARRVVFMTGGSFTGRAEAFLASTPCPRLDKPLNTKVVLDLIATLLGGDP